MTKFTTDTSREESSATADEGRVLPAQRSGNSCELYAPGHQIHYEHQGGAVRSPSRLTRTARLDDTLVTLVLDDGTELHWRHHDPERLGRILEMLRGKCVVYPAYHALRVGPYWFNCASADDEWQDCSSSTAPRG